MTGAVTDGPFAYGKFGHGGTGGFSRGTVHVQACCSADSGAEIVGLAAPHIEA